MEIEKIYVYPIKSMRGVALQTATLTPHGFPNDRRFVVIQSSTNDIGEQTFKFITIADHNELIGFWQDIDFSAQTLKVTHRPANGGEERFIDIPLEPETEGLEDITLDMHKSPTQAYVMEDKYNDFLSSCLGYKVLLAYIGPHRREVRMSALDYRAMPQSSSTNTSSSSSWLSTIIFVVSCLLGTTTPSLIIGTPTSPDSRPPTIGFADVAPYLIASTKSMDSVRSRLPDPEAPAYDIIKFRPNIVVSGAAAVWEEDFWGQLTISSSDSGSSGCGPVQLECEHNCACCRSINIDYATVAQGTGEAGTMLKKLMKDRRVDAGSKWSPIFGRYAFLRREFDGAIVRVGDEVVVSRVNGERTAFDWKGLSTLPGAGRG